MNLENSEPKCFGTGIVEPSQPVLFKPFSSCSSFCKLESVAGEKVFLLYLSEKTIIIK